MLKSFKKKPQVNVGIDIGTSFIKAVAIDKSKATPELLAFFHKASTGDDNASVKEAVGKLGISNISANTSISGPSTAVRIIEMPYMTERELKSAVKFEAEKYLPYKLDEIITDCVKIEDLAGGKIRVLLAAARKTTVNDCIGLFQKAGLALNAIDIDSFAVMNAFLHSQKEDADITCAVVNIGAKTTNVNILRGEQSYLARDIQIAGNNITRAIAEKLNLENDKAEALKINPGEHNDEVTSIIKSIFFNLLDEIRLSFDFYENRYGRNIQKVYLSGGTCRLEGTDDYIKDIFSGDVIPWDPFANVNINPNIDTQALEPIKSSFAVAVGLGLREN